jgi:hypothetical protein
MSRKSGLRYGPAYFSRSDGVVDFHCKDAVIALEIHIPTLDRFVTVEAWGDAAYAAAAVDVCFELQGFHEKWD